MYNPGMEIPSGGIGQIANGAIYIKDMSTDGSKIVVLDVTTPWGTVAADELMRLEPGSNIIEVTGFDTDVNYKYIIKLLDVNETTRKATFQAISVALDDNVGRTLNITDNIPSSGKPSDVIDYKFVVTNNTPANVQVRWLFASALDNIPYFYGPEALPPAISYRNKNCWYDDWASGGSCATGQTIIVGGSIDITGSMVLSDAPGFVENARLMVFVYVPDYWGIGKHEYVMPSYAYGGIFDRPISIATVDLCEGVICSDTCVNNDLWSQVCNPSSGICKPNTLIETNSILCTATHYIEYDFSGLHPDFISWVYGNITTIDNILGDYLPLPTNTQYIGSRFVDSKLRIYTNVAMSAGYDLRYNPLTNRVESLDIWQILTSIAKAIAGVLLLILAGLVAGITGGLALPVIIAVVGVGITTWGLFDIINDVSTPGSIPEPTAEQKIKIVEEFVDEYLSPTCNESYPTCVTDPPTCDSGAMRAHLSCVNNARIAQCIHAKGGVQGVDTTEFCGPIKDEARLIDIGLTDGTITPEDAKNRSDENIVNPVKEIVKETLVIVNCPGGTYDAKLQKCVLLDCFIPNPFGGCLLTKSTAKNIAIVTGLSLGAYVVYKVAK